MSFNGYFKKDSILGKASNPISKTKPVGSSFYMDVFVQALSNGDLSFHPSHTSDRTDTANIHYHDSFIIGVLWGMCQEGIGLHMHVEHGFGQCPFPTISTHHVCTRDMRCRVLSTKIALQNGR